MAAAIARRAAATIPRHLAAATATAAPTFSPAAVTATRPSSAVAFLRRRVHHTSASPEMDHRLSLLEKRVASLEAGAAKHPARQQLEERVARLEVNPNNETARLLVEIDGKISSLELKMDKASFERYAKLQDGQTSLHGRYIQVSDQVRALAFASASRDVKADKQHVESLAQVKKSSWKVCWTVLLGASTVSLGVFNLLKAESRSENLKAAEELFNFKTAELEKSFNTDLESTVKHAVNLALAHKALEASNVQDKSPPGGVTGTTGSGSGGTPGTGSGGTSTGTGSGGTTGTGSGGTPGSTTGTTGTGSGGTPGGTNGTGTGGSS